MGTQADTWADVARRICESFTIEDTAADHAQRRELDRACGELWRLAELEGMRILRSFAPRLGAERIRDLIFDFMATKMSDVAFADTPLAFFRVALRRRAISLIQQHSTAVAEDLPEHDPKQPATEGGAEDHLAFKERESAALEALSRLSERNREIVISRALGYSANEVAAIFKITRANVNRILFLFRCRLDELGAQSRRSKK